MTNDDLHGLDFEPALARCARCGRPAPITEEDVTGDGGGHPRRPVIVPIPDGWFGELEPGVEHDDVSGHEFTGRIVCGDCATPEERVAQALADAEGGRAIRKVMREDDVLDEEEPPDPDDDDPVAA